MTSSDRHLTNGEPRWDYGVQRYKSHRDVFFEPGLISILFLACGRHDVTKRCLLATVDSVARSPLEVEWIFIENGQCEQNYKLFQEINLERKVIVRQRNYGINQGLNQAWGLSRGEFCLIHENDWEVRQNVDFLSIAHDIMQEQPDVGVLQLRAVYDPCENWGLGEPKYLPWSCSNEMLEKANVRLWPESTQTGHHYQISNFPNGFNNNPVIIRKSLYRECGPYPEADLGCDPRHGETEYQERVAKTGCATAHIGIELCYHCGQTTTKAK